MHAKQFLTVKSIQSLMLSGLVITSIASFSSAAVAKESLATQSSLDTQTQKQAKDPIQTSTQSSKWCTFFRGC